MAVAESIFAQVSYIHRVLKKKWNHFIFASNFASAGQFSKFFHQEA